MNMANPVSKSWQDIAKEAQKLRDRSIAAVQPPVGDLPAELPLDVSGLPNSLLTEHEIWITQNSAEDLVELLARGQLSSTAATKAFLRRAAVAQKATNCITELLNERALARAKELDAYLASNRSTVGPLHGLPISVKEHIGMGGLGLNAGFISFWDNVATDDAHILRILWDAGAVFYARTTQPQTVMHLETASNYYGATVNPFNRHLSAGGSSGGEGALVGMKGSCLGIGSDIGGSVRSPAANCGVYGLRPTSGRLPVEGWLATMQGQDHIVPVVGPLSTSIGGIKLFMETVLAAKPWLTEPSLIPMPWKVSETMLPAQQRLRIGVMLNDGVVTPHPPVTRALAEVTARLRDLWGITIVDWTPYKHELAWSIVASLYFADGGAEEKSAIEKSGEPWLPLSRWIIQDNPFVKNLTIEELWQWQIKREQYKVDTANQWNEAGIDVLICPAGPGVAPLLETAKWWGYTSVFNLLDYPAAVFPVTVVDPKVDVRQDGYQPLNDHDRYNFELYDPEKFRGAPVSLQLVARRYEDEKLLGILEMIQQALELPWAGAGVGV